MHERTRTRVLTVQELLDADLSRSRRVHHLNELCTQVVEQPLDVTVTDLRAIVASRIGLEDYRRLHVLISHLYHACSASIPLVTRLRVEVNDALNRPAIPVHEGR